MKTREEGIQLEVGRNAGARIDDRSHGAAPSSEAARTLIHNALSAFLEGLRASFPLVDLQTAIAANAPLPAPANSPEESPGPCKLPRKVLQLLDAWRKNATATLSAELGEAMATVVVTSFQTVVANWAARLGERPRSSPEAWAPLRGWSLRHATALTSQISTSLLARVVTRLEQAICSAANLMTALEEIQEVTASIWFSEEQLDAMADDAAYVATQHGRHEANRQLGATLKVWSIVDDTRTCKICLANSAQGGIPMMRNFQSGHPHPPAHPYCRCTMDYLGITSATAGEAFRMP